MTVGIAIWARVRVVATAWLLAASPWIGRTASATWMITIAAVLLIEDGAGLVVWIASAAREQIAMA